MSGPGERDEDDGRLTVEHHHPGRLRTRSRRFIDEPETATRVASAVRALHGVSAASHNPRTGSLLVIYDPADCDAEQVLSTILFAGHFEGLREMDEQEFLRGRSVTQWMREWGTRIDGGAERVADGAHGMNYAIPLALAGLSAWAWVANPSQRMPAWHQLAQLSLSLFVSLTHNRTQAQKSGRIAPAVPVPLR